LLSLITREISIVIPVLKAMKARVRGVIIGSTASKDGLSNPIVGPNKGPKTTPKIIKKITLGNIIFLARRSPRKPIAIIIAAVRKITIGSKGGTPNHLKSS
jgi:hypothetical protein